MQFFFLLLTDADADADLYACLIIILTFFRSVFRIQIFRCQKIQ